jgi:hypothetical protein
VVRALDTYFGAVGGPGFESTSSSFFLCKQLYIISYPENPENYRSLFRGAVYSAPGILPTASVTLFVQNIQNAKTRFHVFMQTAVIRYNTAETIWMELTSNESLAGSATRSACYRSPRCLIVLNINPRPPSLFSMIQYLSLVLSI